MIDPANNRAARTERDGRQPRRYAKINERLRTIQAPQCIENSIWVHPVQPRKSFPEPSVHRALLGSLERFFGILIEHYAGAFPAWLAPVQAEIIPIADRHIEAGNKIAAELRETGLRVHVDARSDRMNAKIRDAQRQKIPYMLVLGDKEIDCHSVALRKRNGENLGAIPLHQFIDLAKKEIAEKI